MPKELVSREEVNEDLTWDLKGIFASEDEFEAMVKEAKKLAKEIGVPGRVINKKPSADLWEGQTDEKELGITYDELDPILYSYIDLNYDKSKLKTEFDSKKVERVLKLVKSSEHKRKSPEKVKIN